MRMSMQREQAPLPDLLFFQRLSGMNKSGRGACVDHQLRNISFDIARGQKVALLGRSGAGKSTIISLLLRLYEIDDGEILIDGINVKDYQRESLRQQIAIVMQDSVMFGASVRENIAYGKVDATPEEIIRAAKAANAHEFISKLEDGYDTVIGERGGTLSGGQRQRIAIARAFVRSAPILVLDEPMTGLARESEVAVRDALNRLMHGKTCLAITHDLTSAATADRVLLLENGHIRTERGSAGSNSAMNRVLEVDPALPRSVLLGA